MKPSIKRYHPYEARSGKSQNAGVGLFIKDTLDNKERSNLTFSSSGKNCDFECHFIELDCKMLVGVVVGVFHKRLNLLFDLHAPYKESSKKHRKTRKIYG